MSPITSRNIPADVKKAVRKRCSFGCVICGVPVYHYEHIEDFARVREHKIENITLLCPTHHQDKTSGRLPVSRIRRADKNPFNSDKSTTKGHNWYFENGMSHCLIGTNTFSFDLAEDGDRYDAIRINQQCVIGFSRQDEDVLLDLSLVNAQLAPILLIRDGEVLISTKNLDVRLEGRRLLIRPDLGEVPVRISKLDSGLKVHRAKFVGIGKSVFVDEYKLTVRPSGVVFRNSFFHNLPCGLSV